MEGGTLTAAQQRFKQGHLEGERKGVLKSKQEGEVNLLIQLLEHQFGKQPVTRAPAHSPDRRGALTGLEPESAGCGYTGQCI